jgi:hypothetical protein
MLGRLAGRPDPAALQPQPARRTGRDAGILIEKSVAIAHQIAHSRVSVKWSPANSAFPDLGWAAAMVAMTV